VQTGSGRAPLIIAIVAAIITYAALGPQTPFGFLHHAGHHKITISTDKSDDAADAARQKAEDARQAAEDARQEAADRAQDQAERARDQAQEMSEKAEELGRRASEIAQAASEKAVAAITPLTAVPAPPAAPAAPAAPAVPAAGAEQRGLEPFDSVTIENNASATITIGDTQSVSVSGGLGHTETRVHDGKLLVSGSIPGVKVAITVPHLKSVEVNGYGKVNLEGLRDPVTIKANGAIKLSASGMVDSAQLILNGPSKFDVAKLQARTVTVEVNGVGDADVYATETLVADVKGVGHIRYRGDPHLVTKINGPGSVQRLVSDAG